MNFEEILTAGKAVADARKKVAKELLTFVRPQIRRFMDAVVEMGYTSVTISHSVPLYANQMSIEDNDRNGKASNIGHAFQSLTANLHSKNAPILTLMTAKKPRVCRL